MIDRILVADDEFLVRQFLEESISRQGHEVVCAFDGREAIAALDQHDVQMAFVDLKMGDVTGMDVLRHARQHHPHVMVVVMTAYGTVETAVEAMHLGAFDFLLKPFAPDQALVLIEKARRWSQLAERQEYLQREVAPPVSGCRIIGSSDVMRRTIRLAQRVAPTPATVLVTGESGTGKELIAGEIHRLAAESPDRPYVRMNCAAVPENLLESELFGHEKGAFTGAAERRIGRFELADGGTLLLDEIGEISAAMQAKLLRVLQESEFERVGGTKTISVNVRVIATTNRDLKAEVVKGTFREDLFYRLNVFPLHMPPLRDREGDVVEIATELLARESRKLHRSLEFSPGAFACLRKYHWPGNVRELQNVVERIAILEDGPVIEASALPPELGDPAPRAQTTETADDTLNLREIERFTIRRALATAAGNRTKAAELLGFSVRTLRNKLNEYRQEGDPVDAEPAGLAS
jgi:two-component system response regulator AtoC